MAQNEPANQIRERDVSLDIMKCLGILMVVYAHTLPFCRNLIHVMAIPSFLMISGYCWHTRIQTPRDFGRFFLKRLKALYVPFVLYNGTYALLGGLFLKLGFYTDDPKKNPNAKRLSVIEHVDDSLKDMAKGSGSTYGTGGMYTKVAAAEIACHAGADLAILSSTDLNLIVRLLNGKDVGTLFVSDTSTQFDIMDYIVNKKYLES